MFVTGFNFSHHIWASRHLANQLFCDELKSNPDSEKNMRQHFRKKDPLIRESKYFCFSASLS